MKKDKYLAFTNTVFDFIKAQIDESQNGCCRPNSNIYFYDTFGKIITFLVVYYKTTENNDVISFARHQLDYYISNNGIIKITFISFHGIRKANHKQVVSSVWGRWISWYFLALSYFHKETWDFEKEFIDLSRTLNELRNTEGLWSQIPGTSNVLDASYTTFFFF